MANSDHGGESATARLSGIHLTFVSNNSVITALCSRNFVNGAVFVVVVAAMKTGKGGVKDILPISGAWPSQQERKRQFVARVTQKERVVNKRLISPRYRNDTVLEPCAISGFVGTILSTAFVIMHVVEHDYI